MTELAQRHGVMTMPFLNGWKPFEVKINVELSVK
jgi:hypothetical protein